MNSLLMLQVLLRLHLLFYRFVKDSVWSFDGNGLMRLVPSMSESTSSRVISFCLHALFAHSKVINIQVRAKFVHMMILLLTGLG